MADPQLGLFLYRIARDEAEPAAVLARQRERFFKARGTDVIWKAVPFLGTPVTVEKQTLGAPSANVLHSCLVPVDRYWLFVGMDFELRVPARMVERTWSEMSRSLRVVRKRWWWNQQAHPPCPLSHLRPSRSASFSRSRKSRG